jgi:hypothetical protein
MTDAIYWAKEKDWVVCGQYCAISSYRCLPSSKHSPSTIIPNILRCNPCEFLVLKCVSLVQTAWRLLAKDCGVYTISVKLSDFTVWRHTWRKNWVNCAVLTGNSVSLRTVLSSRLSHTENCAVHSWNPTVSSVYLPIPRWHTQEKKHSTDKKTDKPDGEPVLCQRTFSSVLHAFLKSV